MVSDRFNESMRNIFEGMVRMKDMPKRTYPVEESRGVPQRAYGYITPDVKNEFGFDKLQTSNVAYCLPLVGKNKNGVFLAHLDEVSTKQVPYMMQHLEKVLGRDFDMTIVVKKI